MKTGAPPTPGRNYPGGLSSFFKEFPPDNFNENLSVFISLGHRAKEIIERIGEHGFNHNEDFVIVDIDLFTRGDNSIPYPPDPEVKWLKAHYANGTVFIIFIAGKPASDQPKLSLVPSLNSPLASTVGHETGPNPMTKDKQEDRGGLPMTETSI